MATTTGGARTVCPYYESDDTCQINCAGFEFGTKVSVKFSSYSDKHQYQLKACWTFEYLKNCPYARMQEAMYDEKV